MNFRFTISLLILLAVCFAGMTAWGADSPAPGSSQAPASPEPAPTAPAADVAPAKREEEAQLAASEQTLRKAAEADLAAAQARIAELERVASDAIEASRVLITERDEARAAIATLNDQLVAEKAAHDATRATLASTAKCANDSVADVLALRQALISGQKPGGTIVH